MDSWRRNLIQNTILWECELELLGVELPYDPVYPCRSVGWMVDWSVCHNFRKSAKFHFHPPLEHLFFFIELNPTKARTQDGNYPPLRPLIEGQVGETHPFNPPPSDFIWRIYSYQFALSRESSWTALKVSGSNSRKNTRW